MISNTRTPEWLRSMWEQKTEQTVERVDAAVKRLTNDGAKVTLAAICSSVLAFWSCTAHKCQRTRFCGIHGNTRFTVLLVLRERGGLSGTPSWELDRFSFKSR